MTHSKFTTTFGRHVYLLRNGALYADVPILDNPIVTMDARAEIKKTFAANLILPDDVNILTDMLAPAVVLDGVEYPLGEYVITTAVEHTDEYGQKYTEVESYDGAYRAKRYRSETLMHFEKGSLYTDVLQRLLQQCGVVKADITPNTARLLTSREDWEIGTSYIEIINQLLGEINNTTLWFDRNGFARSGKSISVSAENIKHTYKRGRYSVIAKKRRSELDVFGKYNVFMALVDNADMENPLFALAENNNPASILSTQNRGRIQAPVERLNNIASQEDLQAYVDAVRDRSMLTMQTVTITTAINPMHEVWDVVALDDGIYKEIGWEIVMGYDGSMTHTLEREVFK